MTETGRYVAEEFYRRRLAAMEAELTVGNYEVGMARIERYRKINNISHHNMKHYTDTIPVELGYLLEDKGMNVKCLQEVAGAGTDEIPPYGQKVLTTYAEVFDWLMEKSVKIYLDSDSGLWAWFIESDYDLKRTEDYPSWHEAANAAIEKALELIKE